jgi:hypothetical protein
VVLRVVGFIKQVTGGQWQEELRDGFLAYSCAIRFQIARQPR